MSSDSEASSSMMYEADDLKSSRDLSPREPGSARALSHETHRMRPGSLMSVDLSDDDSITDSSHDDLVMESSNGDGVTAATWPEGPPAGNVRMFRTVPLVLDEALEGTTKPRLLASTRGPP
jgi:hypothetical protein